MNYFEFSNDRCSIGRDKQFSKVVDDELVASFTESDDQ
jgi:hypothetical protein